MPRLIQLDNGDWFDPTTIKTIRAGDEHCRAFDDHKGTDMPPRVVIETKNCYAVFEYPTFAAACEARDRLAARVNEAADSDPLDNADPGDV